MALRQINMIPPDVLAKTVLFRHLWFWSKGFICVCLVFIAFYLGQTLFFLQQQKAHHSDAYMNTRTAGQIDTALQDIAKLKAQMQDLTLKTGLLAAMANRQSYHDILAVLADSFNDETCLDHLSVQRGSDMQTDKALVMVEGFSMAHNALGHFLASLSGSPRVQDVVLIDSKKNEPSQDQPFAIRFKLSCTIVKKVSK